ncbi:MAG: hypothetical protein KGI27_02100 [Thaumarchaeota archaeon]|nr:hypothetical protein [Nitrososphaerota archaeon]
MNLARDTPNNTTDIMVVIVTNRNSSCYPSARISSPYDGNEVPSGPIAGGTMVFANG